ncbi:MAG: GyrI-like domain-containing protein [Arenimonas sp.]
MIDTPHITDSTAQLVAYIHLTIPRDEIRHVMGPGISEVLSVVKAQDIGPVGPWFTHHLKMTAEEFDFEICVPVSSAVTPTGRVQAGELVARKQVARTVYRGSYEGMGEAWGKFMGWIETNGHRPAPDLWEVYRAGPESSTDSSQWQTELNRPLLD